jgi:hypothetical protein
MAKIVGFVGTGSGRVGNMVLSKGPNGLTIARSFQPIVANPRTDAQLNQRAKVNLAGRVSKLVPAQAISGLSMGSNRLNRSEFLANLIKSCVVTKVAGVWTASVLPEKVVFSHGNETPAATMGTISLAANAVTLPLSNVTADNQHGERVIVMVLNGDVDGYYKRCQFTDVIYSEGQKSIVVNLAMPLEDDEMVLVYRCPFSLVSRKRGAVTSPVFFDDNILARLEMTTSPNATFGQSIFHGSAVFTAA